MAKEEVIGNIYGRWEVIGNSDSRNGARYVLCRCSCKKKTIKEIHLGSLKAGRSSSCGCYNLELLIERNGTHGLAKYPLYSLWGYIKNRCYNKNYKRYKDWGGRGIIMCDEWLHNPRLFMDWCMNNGWEDGLEIDRKDNDGNYEPSNCRFVTSEVNNLNQRTLTVRNKTGFRGIYWREEGTAYCATVRYKGKLILNKSGFKIAKEAAIYRDKFIVQNRLKHPLNFPELAINGTL
ncbi:MAG: hypothetical protein WC055_00650 [Melioribacteraceae bacterium]